MPDQQYDPAPDWWLENLYRTGLHPVGTYPGRVGQEGDAWNPNASFLENMNPDFQYWEHNTTQSDINTSMLSQNYADQFQDEADRYGEFEDQLFQQMMQTASAGGEGGANFDEAARAAEYMMRNAGEGYFGGHAGDAGSFQGQVQQALASVGQQGFGVGHIGNAFATAAGRGVTQSVQAGAATAPDVLRTLSQRDVGIMNALQNTYSSAGYGQLRAGAIENAYNADMFAADNPFVRSGERQNRDFMRRAEPDILESIRRGANPPSRGEDLAWNVGERLVYGGVGYLWDRYGPGGTQWQSDPRNGGGYQSGPNRAGSPYGGDTGYYPPGYDGGSNFGPGAGNGGREQPGGYVDHWDPNSYNPYQGHEDAERY